MRLLSAPGPRGTSGPRAGVAGVLLGFAARWAAIASGSSFARVPGTAGGPRLAVVGHIDEIGLHVSHIDDDGYLRFGQVGGWDPAC